jgi:hypothetical protein
MGQSNDEGDRDDFLSWGRAVVNSAAARLEREIAGARRGTESHLNGYEALYVHFRDQRIPQDLAVWIFAARSGTANNVRGYKDAIGVGLKHSANVELDQGAWFVRPLSPLRWTPHVDARYEGYRWLRSAGELPQDPDEAGTEIAARVLATLRSTGALAT